MSTKNGRIERRSFAKIKEIVEMPNLLSVQISFVVQSIHLEPIDVNRTVIVNMVESAPLNPE